MSSRTTQYVSNYTQRSAYTTWPTTSEVHQIRTKVHILPRFSKPDIAFRIKPINSVMAKGNERVVGFQGDLNA